MDQPVLEAQEPGQIVDIGGWLPHDEHGVFPVGSKPKKMLLCPDKSPFPFLIPGHKYIFKTTPGWREQQLWSEAIAYELSKLSGVAVPPCFVAIDGRTEQAGVLMEVFYGYPDERPTTRLVHGTDILQRSVPRYNPKSGRPHDVVYNVAICRAFRIARARQWWAQTLVFDSLIGNTDRHAENWGLLRGTSVDPARLEWKMAPAFDNGTSLGYEILENQLEKHSTAEAVERHIMKGRHHATWQSISDTKGEPFFTLCASMFRAYPEIRGVIERVIPTSDAPIDEIVSRCVGFDLPVRFSAARASFVERIIRARRSALVSRLGL
ncbi:MAG TPA: HipA domain-containing protein [Rhizomicrobium sp.]|jgi:hypothetical protein